MPGFVTVLKRIAGVWREKKDLIRQQSADTMRQLSEAMQPKGSSSYKLCRRLHALSDFLPAFLSHEEHKM